MALTAAKRPKPLVGNPLPRVAPPRPLHHGLTDYREEAARLDIDPMPWQDTAATYLTARGPDGLFLYREVAVVVGRQNGKTTLTKPLIVERLKAGRHIMHIAQVRELPRIMFEAIADALEETPELFPRRRGKIIWPRRGAGSESIVLTNGGSYRIAAAVSGSARGHSIDDLIIDELREMDSFDVVNSAKPAQRFSDDPQTVYLSNMGTDESVVLNSLIMRAAEDRSLAYLEWSADPDYPPDDRRGWVASNPAIGHYPQVLRDLEKDYVAAKLGGNLAGFETEALCRKVPTMRDRLIDDAAWLACAGPLGSPVRPSIGIALDPGNRRASIALAWMRPDRKVALQLVENVAGDPVDTDSVGELLKLLALRHNAKVGYELEDSQLMKYVKKEKGIAFGGGKAKAASAEFARLVSAGALVWANCDPVTDDLTWTARKQDHDGTYEAVRAKDDHPIPAALAAIRAVYMASLPQSEGRLVVR